MNHAKIVKSIQCKCTHSVEGLQFPLYYSNCLIYSYQSADPT